MDRANADTLKSSAPLASPDDATVATRIPRDASTLRMLPHTGPPTPAVVTRMRRIGDALERIPDDDTVSRLVLPEGALGDAELALGRADTAEAMRVVDGSLAGRAIKARAQLMEGLVDDATQTLGADRGAPEVALADAALALALGDVSHAERRVREALDKNPNGLGEVYLHALVKVAEGQMQEAHALLCEVAKAAPSHAVARYQLGQLLLAQGDGARAGTAFEMAWDLSPTFVAPALALAEMLADSRQVGEALTLLANVCERAPTTLSPRLLQLRVLLDVGEYDSARDLAERLHETLPDEPEVSLLWADAIGDHDAARAQPVLEALLARPLPAAYAQRARKTLAKMHLGAHPPRVDEGLALLEGAAASGGALAGELWLEAAQAAAAHKKPEHLDRALTALVDAGDVSSALSGALLARAQGLSAHARGLAESARDRVRGTSAESQLDAFIAALP
jgi:tetratricopeptide (TPR) repeat protein